MFVFVCMRNRVAHLLVGTPLSSQSWTWSFLTVESARSLSHFLCAPFSLRTRLSRQNTCLYDCHRHRIALTLTLWQWLYVQQWKHAKNYELRQATLVGGSLNRKPFFVFRPCLWNTFGCVFFPVPCTTFAGQGWKVILELVWLWPSRNWLWTPREDGWLNLTSAKKMQLPLCHCQVTPGSIWSNAAHIHP